MQEESLLVCSRIVSYYPLIAYILPGMNELSRKRFVRALRYAQETLAGDARCYCYEHELDYLAVKEDLKYAIRLLEEGEEVAARLLRRKLNQEFAKLELQED